MHTKSFSVSIELNKAKDTGIECIVSNRYTVRIPKVIREKLSICPREIVNVGLSCDQKSLLISKTYQKTTDNKVVVSENNNITIPIELRRYLKIKRADKLKVYSMSDKIAVFKK